MKRSMGYRCNREKGPDTPSIIIANHNTDVDPALVAMGFTGHMYFVASEHAFRKGFFSKVLVALFAPIAIVKTKVNAAVVKETLRRLRAGFNVCIFAEGNRSYTGITGSIPPSTAKLVKISGAALITYRLEGGYFTMPRWGKKKRKGQMTGSVVGRYSAEQLQAMTEEEIFNAIERDIHEDAYQRQAEHPVRFRGADLAEYIEAVLYACPGCGKIGTIHSQGDRFFCDCGLEATYTETGLLEGNALPYSTISDWNKWQVKHLEGIVRAAGDEEWICADENQTLFTVQEASETVLVGEGFMQMSRTELQCAGLMFPLEQISRFAIVDKMTLLFALKDGTQYEVRNAAPRSALKYLEAFRMIRSE